MTTIFLANKLIKAALAPQQGQDVIFGKLVVSNSLPRSALDVFTLPGRSFIHSEHQRTLCHLVKNIIYEQKSWKLTHIPH